MHELLQEILMLPDAALLRDELDHLLDEEYQRRLKFREDITEDDKAEFINGEIIYHSPVKWQHNVVAKRILHVLNHYVERYSLGYVGYEKVLVAFTRNDYEPDICYFNQSKVADFKLDQMIFPIPDLVVEVLSPSTEAYDRKIKYKDFESHGVTEYWIADPADGTLEQYCFENGKYSLRFNDCEGMIVSEAVPGFSTDVAIFFDDEVYNIYVLKEEREIAKMKKEILAKDNLLSEKDNLLSEKDNLLSEKDNLLSEKDNQLAKKEELISQQNNSLAEKERLINELQRKIRT